MNNARLVLALDKSVKSLRQQLTNLWLSGLEKQMIELEASIRPSKGDDNKSAATQTSIANIAIDILTFVDNKVCTLLADVSLVISLHDDLFGQVRLQTSCKAYAFLICNF